MGAIFSALGILLPYVVVSVFLTLTPEITEITNTAIRLYFMAFLPAGYNILSSYYLQCVLKTKESLALSILRSIVLSSAFVLLLPLFFEANVLWLCMPITEAIVFLLSVWFVIKISY